MQVSESQAATLDPVVAAETPSEQDENYVALTFRGNGRDYFRIWVVNVFLTIVTLGVFSAWAKVRKRRYFYRHTRLLGDGFDYHADPRRILTGRALVLPILLVYLLGGYFVPGIDLVAMLLIVLILPYFLVKAARFNARNTSFRNIRFGFDGTVSTSYKEFFKALGFTLVSFGTAATIFEFGRRQFVAVNSRFGQESFSFGGKFGDFFVIYLKAGGLAILAFVAYAMLLMPLIGALMPDDLTGVSPETFFYVYTMIAFLIYYAVWVYTSVRTRNYIYSNMSLGGHAVRSDLSARTLFGIHFVNLILIVLTFGLFLPFASVRVLKYKLAHTYVSVEEGFDHFTATRRGDQSATGEEVGDLFDFDLGV